MIYRMIYIMIYKSTNPPKNWILVNITLSPSQKKTPGGPNKKKLTSRRAKDRAQYLLIEIPKMNLPHPTFSADALFRGHNIFQKFDKCEKRYQRIVRAFANGANSSM